jgi:hypothetical protein
MPPHQAIQGRDREPPQRGRRDGSAGAGRPDLGDDVHDAGAVRGAERVDEVADEEGEERHRKPVDDCREGAHRHHRRVPTVREGEESVHRHRPRASRSPAVAGFRHRSLYAATALPPPSSGRSLRRGGAMVNAWTGGLLCVFYAEGRLLSCCLWTRRSLGGILCSYFWFAAGTCP